LEKILRKNGFHTVDAVRVPMHGGSLRIAAAINPDEAPKNSVAEIMQYERTAGLDKATTWVDFGSRVGRKIEVVKETFQHIAKGATVWGYGAAGKATLWVNACEMNYLGAMVDGSPLRAGKLMPGTHTPIVFPEELEKQAPDYIFVTAWNYADLIKSKTEWFKGIWSTPLPDLRFF
jgi:methylation protein EvaC